MIYKFATNLFLLILAMPLGAKEINLFYQSSTGQLDIIKVAQKNMVFEINNHRIVSKIYVFTDKIKAIKYLESTRPQNLSLFSQVVTLPFNWFRGPQTTVYIEKDIKLKPLTRHYTGYYKKSALEGAIKTINHMKIEYFRPQKFSQSPSVVGLVKQINGVKLTYHSNGQRSVDGLFDGKIASVGTHRFYYNLKSRTTLAGHYVGKLDRISNIKIAYYEGWSRNRGIAGKVRKLGHINFDYYNHSPIPGQTDSQLYTLRRRLGSDNRFILRTSTPDVSPLIHHCSHSYASFSNFHQKCSNGIICQ